MIDLSDRIGLPVSVDPRALALQLGEGLIFGSGAPDEDPAERWVDDMRTVLRDHDVQVHEPLLYTMYRDVRRRGGSPWRDYGLRLDITVIRPGTLGSELVKTQGHYHPTPSDGALPYPEVYEVAHGRAHFLLQHARDMMAAADNQGIDSVLWVEAEPGEKVVMVPGYGHITTNPGDDVLVLVDLVDGGFESIYQPILEARGGAYRELADGTWEKNPHQPHAAALRQAASRPWPEMGLWADKPLAVAADDNPADFVWLSNPDPYVDQFKEVIV